MPARFAMLAACAAFVLAACSVPEGGGSDAGAASKAVRRVVYFVASDKDRETGMRDFREFTRAVQRAGIDTKDVSLELLNVVGPGAEPARRALAELARRPPDVLVATSQFCLEAVLHTPMHVPILFLSHPDPVALGDVVSLARPGVDRTGFTFFSPVTAKHLETLHDGFPSVRRVGAVVDAYLMGAKWFTDDVHLAEASLGLEVTMFAAGNVAALRRVLATAQAARMDAWYVPVSEITSDDPDQVIALMHALNKPIVYSRVSAVLKGGTIAYEARLEDPFGIWARQLRLILAGVSAASIPVEQPQSFEIAVNLDGSREHRALRPSKAILKRATRIVGAPEN